MRRVVLPIAAVLLTAACSSTAHTLPAVGPKPSSTSPTKAIDLQAALLTSADLPTGWSQASPPAAGGENSDCAPMAGVTHRLGRPVVAEFRGPGGTFAPFLTEYLSAGSPNQAGAAMSAAKTAPDSCHKFTDPKTFITSTMTRLPFPAVGDDRLAVHNSFSSVFQSDDVVVRVGGALILIIYADPTHTLDTPLLQHVARAAVARVQS